MRKLALLIGILACSCADAESFVTWKKEQWDGERAKVIAPYVERAKTEGILPVYGDLQKQVALVPAATPQEQQWRNSFECVMSRRIGVADVLEEELQKTAIGMPFSESSRARSRDAAVSYEFLSQVFRPENAGLRPQYRLFHQGFKQLDAACPNHEIVIEPSSESVVAQQLYRISDILDIVMEDQMRPVKEETAGVIRQSRTRWDAFFKNVMLDQYFWETYVNEFGQRAIPALRGSLAQPPRAQIRIAHPTPLVVVDDSDGSAFEPSLGIEVLGWRSYDRDSYEPKWGASVVAVLETDSVDSTGYGLLLQAKSFSIGAIVRDTAEKSDDIQLVLGVDIAKLFDNRSKVSEERTTELEKALRGILYCADSGFKAKCSTQ